MTVTSKEKDHLLTEKQAVDFAKEAVDKIKFDSNPKRCSWAARLRGVDSILVHEALFKFSNDMVWDILRVLEKKKLAPKGTADRFSLQKFGSG